MPRIRHRTRRTLAERAAFGAFWCALWVAGGLLYGATGNWVLTFLAWGTAVVLAAGQR